MKDMHLITDRFGFFSAPKENKKTDILFNLF
jgi:hypothetical protein